VEALNMGLFRKDKYEKGDIIRGTIDIVKGIGVFSNGVVRSAAGNDGNTLKYKVTKDIIKGRKNMIQLIIAEKRYNFSCSKDMFL
jgi:hypothetical protein